MVVPRGSNPQPSRGDGMKADNRELITLLGKWRQRTKRSDYLSSPLVWLGSSSLPHSTIRELGLRVTASRRQKILSVNLLEFPKLLQISLDIDDIYSYIQRYKIKELSVIKYIKEALTLMWLFSIFYILMVAGNL